MSIFDWLSVILIGVGEVCVLLALLGVFRLDYVLNRMHATTIADTMGTLFIFAGVILHYGLCIVSAKLLLVLIFQWLTAPVSGHMIARMCYTIAEHDVERHAELTFEREEEE